MPEPAYVSGTRAAYDTVADDYAELLRGELESKPLDRGLLAAFAEQVLAAGGGPVADLGCGPGRITTHLRALGLDAFGIDLSPAMVAVARRTYPDLRFDVGSITDLDLPDGGLGGVVAWYSAIHTPPEQLGRVFAEFARVLAPGSRLLLAFQAGSNEQSTRDVAYGHPVSLVSYRLNPAWVAAELARAGLATETQVLREPTHAFETMPQAYLLARRSAHAAPAGG